ncbi:ATP-binding cassette domain-containing protein [bacterium]|nr:ATP-binding cassette domain-containing protein [bacterium]
MSIENKCVFELCNLVHRLENKATGEHFTIHVEKDIKLQSKDFVGLLGPSGCGKTTLLTILGLLRSPSDLKGLGDFRIHVPDSGNQERRSIDIKEAWAKKRYCLIENIRREHVGFALQSGELINSLTVGENIQAPLRLNGWSVEESESRLSELLESFSLFRGAADDFETVRQRNLARARINRLSGGEYQRVALARSIAHRPSVVFVDEPTSALNRQLAFDALNTLKMNQVSQEKAGVTFMITHDEDLADEFCNVVIRMAPCKGRPAGEVVEVLRKPESGELDV